MVYVTVNMVCACCVHVVCHIEHGVRMLCSWCMSQRTWCLHGVFMVYVTVNGMCACCVYGVCLSNRLCAYEMCMVCI